MTTQTFLNCSDCCGSAGCDECSDLLEDPPPVLTISDGVTSQEMAYSGGEWSTSPPNLLMGAVPGLPEADVTYNFFCNAGTAIFWDHYPANTFECNPLEATFGPMTGFDGGTYTLTVTRES